MTWAKVDDRFNDDPKMLALSRGVRLLFVEGLVWSCRHATDGHIPRHVLGKVTDESDAADAAKQLVAAGIWADTEHGWEIVGFLDELDQTPADEIAQSKEFARDRQRRRRQHLTGNHDECLPKYCEVAKRLSRDVTRDTGDVTQNKRVTADVTRDVTRDNTRDQRLPNRTHPTPREGGGRSGLPPALPTGRAASARNDKTPRHFTVGGPPPVNQLCAEHAQDRETCVWCAKEASA